MHLDRRVIERAEALLSAQERDYERALDELAHERVRTTTEREALERDRTHLRTLEDEARKRVEALERERREVAPRGEARLAAALREFSAELERRAAESRRPRADRASPAVRASCSARTIDELRAGLGISRSAHGGAPQERAGADRGRRPRDASSRSSAKATVVEDLGDEAMVQLGALRMTVPKAGCAGAADRRGRAARGPSTTARRSSRRRPARAPSSTCAGSASSKRSRWSTSGSTSRCSRARRRCG